MKNNKWKLITVSELGYLNARGIKRFYRAFFDVFAILTYSILIACYYLVLFVPIGNDGQAIDEKWFFIFVFGTGIVGVFLMLLFSRKTYSSKTMCEYYKKYQKMKLNMLIGKRQHSFVFKIRSIEKSGDKYRIIFGNQMEIVVTMSNPNLSLDDSLPEAANVHGLSDDKTEGYEPIYYAYDMTQTQCRRCIYRFEWYVFTLALLLLLGLVSNGIFQNLYVHEYHHLHSSFVPLRATSLGVYLILVVTVMLVRAEDFFYGDIVISRICRNEFIITASHNDKCIERLLKINKVAQIKNHYVLVDDRCNFVFVPLDFPIDKLDLDPKCAKLRNKNK